MAANKDKLNIWIVYQYVMPPEHEERFRSIKMAEYLIEKGHNVLLVGGSYLHNQNINLIEGREPFVIREYQGLKFAHIKIGSYVDNGIKRIWSLIQFQTRLYRLARKIAAASENTPDVMICDDAPFPFYREIKTAERFGAKAIKEVRDLWPESLVAYDFLKRESLLAKYLYRLERKVYERADRLIFAMEGGRDYIREKGWDLNSGGRVDLSKVHYINNGVDLSFFDEKAETYRGYGEDWFDPSYLNFIYAGSVRTVNDLGLFLRPFSKALDKGKKIRLLVVGDGDRRTDLEKEFSGYKDEIRFTGAVDKERIPALLLQSDVCVLCSTCVSVCKYGVSQNKLFDYMAAGRPILNMVASPFDWVDDRSMGITTADQSEETIEAAITRFVEMTPDERAKMGVAARKAVIEFDYRALTDKLVAVLETL